MRHSDASIPCDGLGSGLNDMRENFKKHSNTNQSSDGRGRVQPLYLLKSAAGH